MAERGTSSLKVICDTTDVCVLLVHFYAQEHLTCQLVMISTSTDRVVVVDIKVTTEEHSAITNHQLPAHTLSGCNTVSQLYEAGKGTTLKMINSRHQLNNLGNTTVKVDQATEEATAFIATCHGARDRNRW